MNKTNQNLIGSLTVAFTKLNSLFLPEQAPVDVWTIALDEPRPLLLSAEEQQRASRFYFEKDRVHWANARSALRLILAGYASTKPEKLRFNYGPHGKPALQNAAIHFNISHSGGYAMVAVARAAPVGIDIEQIRDNVDIGKLLLRIGEAAPPASTEELFRTWTRREARTKALGIPLMEIPVGDLHTIDLDAPTQFAAALALLNRTPNVSYRDFRAL